MVSLKLVVLALTVAVAIAIPCDGDHNLLHHLEHHSNGLKPSIISPIKGNNLGVVGNVLGSVVNAGKKLVRKPFHHLGYLIGGITNRAGDGKKILESVTKYKANKYDVYQVILRVVYGLSRIMSAKFPGAGILFTTLVVGSLKILYCVLGKNIYNHIGLNPSVCSPEFGTEFGLKKYTEKYDTVQEVISFYQLQKIEGQLKAILTAAAIAKGLHGLEVLDGPKTATKYIALWVLQLAQLGKRNALEWKLVDRVPVIVLIAKIYGGTGNSYVPGLGPKLVNEFIEYISAHQPKPLFGGVDIKTKLPEIKSEVVKVISNNFNGALKTGVGFKHLGKLIKGITNQASDATEILHGLVKRIPSTFDVFQVIVKVVQGISIIINKVLAGSSILLTRLIVGSLKILFCVLGKNYSNKNGIHPSVCSKDFAKDFGLKSYTGKYDSVQEIIDFYQLDKIKDQLTKIINHATKGKGVDSLNGTPKYIAQWLLQLSTLCSRDASAWKKEDTIPIVVDISKIMGGIGNSYKKGLGNLIANEFVTYISIHIDSTFFGDFDITLKLSDINDDIDKCGGNNFNGALDTNNQGENYSNDDNTGYVESNESGYETDDNTDTTTYDNTGTTTTGTTTTGNTDTTITDTTTYDNTGTTTTGTTTTGTATTGNTDTTTTGTITTGNTGTITTGTTTTGNTGTTTTGTTTTGNTDTTTTGTTITGTTTTGNTGTTTTGNTDTTTTGTTITGTTTTGNTGTTTTGADTTYTQYNNNGYYNQKNDYYPDYAYDYLNNFDFTNSSYTTVENTNGYSDNGSVQYTIQNTTTTTTSYEPVAPKTQRYRRVYSYVDVPIEDDE